MTDPKTLPPLRVAMIGYSFMGAAHSHAWRTAPRFFDLPLDRRDGRSVVGRNAGGVAAAASKLRLGDDRDRLAARDRARRHRPHRHLRPRRPARRDRHRRARGGQARPVREAARATRLAEAEAMADAARRARDDGVRAMVGFTYRRVPAVALMRRLVEQGRIGEVRHVRAPTCRTGSRTRTRR